MRYFNDFKWDTVFAFNSETFRVNGSPGRHDRRELILKKLFFEKLKELNPGLRDQAYTLAYEKLTEESVTKSIADINFEKHVLMTDGIPVDFINEKGEQVINKILKVFDFDEPSKNEFPAVQQLWIQGKSNRNSKTKLVYEHLKKQYFGGGKSIYGKY